jgi:hypothetical protein
MEHVTWPNEHAGTVMDYSPVVQDLIGVARELFYAAVTGCIDVDVTDACEHEKIIVLKGMHVPWAGDVAHGAGRYGVTVVKDSIHRIDMRDGVRENHVETNAWRSPQRRHGDDSI